MKALYKLTSDKINGQLLVTFENGWLRQFEVDVKELLTPHQYEVVMALLPIRESEIHQLRKVNLTIEKVDQPQRVNDKIGLFCRLYEKYVGVKYKVSAADSGKMKLLKVDNDLLTHYFESDNFLFKDKYSIGNLAKYFNELLAEHSNKGKMRFPNRWDSTFAMKLNGGEISEYWRHLSSLGLKPKKDRFGNTVDWV